MTISSTFVHYAEKLFQACYNRSKWQEYIMKNVKLENLELLDETLSRGRGILMVTGHFGAMEFLPSALNFKGFPPVMVARFKTAKLRSISIQRAESVGFSILDCDLDPHPLLTSIKHLKDGKILILECDEADSWHPDPNRQIEFLGHPVLMDRTIDLIEKKAHSPVLTAFVRRTEDNRYLIELEEIVLPDSGGSYSESVMKALERYIYAYPEQWYHWNEFDKMLAGSKERSMESSRRLTPMPDSLFTDKQSRACARGTYRGRS
jgi:lauroyl/myristoyl acyltransferase